MTEISSELSKTLSDAIERMPPFPKSVQRILELSRDINFPPKELASVIEKDPVMTENLLRTLNSAYYSLPKQITSVNHAIVFLGLNTIKNVALSIALIGTLPQKNTAGYDIQRYLMHSLVTASLARLLCQKFSKDGTDPGDCNLAGLLHDFGQTVFAQFLPEEFRQALSYSSDNNVPLYIAERHIIGVDHGTVSAMLVDRWQFPKYLSDAIRHHHDGTSVHSTLHHCLFVADQLSKHKTLCNSSNGMVTELPAAMADRFGGNLDEIILQLGDLSNVVAEARAFAQTSKEIRP